MSQRRKPGKCKMAKKRRGKNVKLVSLLFVIVVIVGFFSFVATGFQGVAKQRGGGKPLR